MTEANSPTAEIEPRIARLEAMAHPPVDWPAEMFTILSAMYKLTASSSAAEWQRGLSELRDLMQQYCPGHVASPVNPKICARCDTHIAELAP